MRILKTIDRWVYNHIAQITIGIIFLVGVVLLNLLETGIDFLFPAK